MLKSLGLRAPTIVAAARRRFLSSESQTVRLSRDERRKLREQKLVADSGRNKFMRWGPLLVGAGGSIFVGWGLTADAESSALAKSMQEFSALKWFLVQFDAMAKPFTAPSRAKLLPDWPMPYLNVPPETPALITLVLDLEDTLITDTWDQKYGYRYAKRPGLENFLKECAGLFEVVAFSPNMAQMVDPIISSIDKKGEMFWHRLYRDATRFQGGHHLKDISKLNRDPRKILLIDDDKIATKLHPDNCIHVPPYKDVNDKDDDVLMQLLPFLKAISNEKIDDIPKLMRTYNSRDAADISSDYNQRLNDLKAKEQAVRDRGIGGAVRAYRAKAGPAEVPLRKPSADAGPSSRDIVGDAPDAAETVTKGSLWQAYDSRNKEREEEMVRKQEVYQRLMMKRQQEQMERQQAGTA